MRFSFEYIKIKLTSFVSCYDLVVQVSAESQVLELFQELPMDANRGRKRPYTPWHHR